MAKKKRKKSAADWFADVSIHGIFLHPVSLFLGATLLVLLVSSALWQQHKQQIAVEQYRLTEAKIIVNEQPDWIRTQLRTAVFETSSLEEKTLLDTDVVERVRDAFSIHPWVEKVVEVKKTPSNIQVQVQFRQPVAMVELGEKHLLPIDRNGVILDGRDLNTAKISQYIRINVKNPVAGQIVTGHVWPDARVIAAAKIAEALEDDWQQMGVYRIVNNHPPTIEPSNVGQFELWTESHTRLLWGNAPGQETEVEASPKEKIEAVLREVKQHGSLSQQHNVSFDIRSGTLRPFSSLRNVSHKK